MALLWSQKFSVGVKELDRHHKKLFSLLNDSIDAVAQKKGRETVITILKELDYYAEYHFKAEEELFQKTNYPDAIAHMQEHREFHGKLIKIHESLQKYNESAGLELLNFLSAWFTSHVMTVDKKYIPYLGEIK